MTLLFRRPLSINRLLLIAAVYLAATQNLSFARKVLASLSMPPDAAGWLFIAAIAVVVGGLMLLVAALLSFPRTVRPWLALLFVIAAVCSYFMDAYGVVISDSMIANAIETDRREAGELLKASFLLHVLLQGMLPAVIAWKLPLAVAPPLRELLRRLALVGATLLAVSVAIGVEYKTFVLWGRENRDVRLYLNPTYPLNSVFKYFRGAPAASEARAPEAIATDAVRTPRGARPLLVVLVVGETARAANFQLDGYARATNPRLAAIGDVINFPQVHSCGTATAESVPCMFSGLGRENFSKRAAAARQNVLDVLAATDVQVAWRDNNSGCKGVCNRVEVQDFNDEHTDPLCASGECFDEILLQDLERYVPAAGKATLVVLHQKGSHGPAYHLRYPPAFRAFTPDCVSDYVQQCTREEITNAYDNTLVYTDFVLASLVERLRAKSADADVAMLYVSDHGESLGENGLYLHGLPYAIAPDEQKHVPMIAWFDGAAASDLGIDLACVRAHADSAYSHDNLFHTLLGLFGVSSSVYLPALDVFAACRR